MTIKRDTKFMKVKWLVSPHKDHIGYVYRSEFNEWHLIIDNQLYCTFASHLRNDNVCLNNRINLIHSYLDDKKYDFALEEFSFYLGGLMKYPYNDEIYNLAEITYFFLDDNYDIA